MAGDPGVPTHRTDQRPHRRSQPVGQAGQTRRLRLPQHRELTAPDTLPLHPRPAGQHRIHYRATARLTAKSHQTCPKSKTTAIQRLSRLSNRRTPPARKIEANSGREIVQAEGATPRERMSWRKLPKIYCRRVHLAACAASVWGDSQLGATLGCTVIGRSLPGFSAVPFTHFGKGSLVHRC